jgi:hypothetical protein
MVRLAIRLSLFSHMFVTGFLYGVFSCPFPSRETVMPRIITLLLAFAVFGLPAVLMVRSPHQHALRRAGNLNG